MEGIHLTYFYTCRSLNWVVSYLWVGWQTGCRLYNVGPWHVLVGAHMYRVAGFYWTLEAGLRRWWMFQGFPTLLRGVRGDRGWVQNGKVVRQLLISVAALYGG